eukprot:g33053.t1
MPTTVGLPNVTFFWCKVGPPPSYPYNRCASLSPRAYLFLAVTAHRMEGTEQELKRFETTTRAGPDQQEAAQHREPGEGSLRTLPGASSCALLLSYLVHIQLCCSLPRATCLDSDPPALQIPRYSYSFHRMVRALSLALLNLCYG